MFDPLTAETHKLGLFIKYSSSFKVAARKP